ncbi:hypothetical protein ABZW30_21260 [Kitasatospora sp. NPDC004669]|uniref:hypothetical protein n=1 Tax=Kitasatospora sp. NPDC004669 TaxID=3154555 RepID=UPI0033ACD60A
MSNQPLHHPFETAEVGDAPVVTAPGGAEVRTPSLPGTDTEARPEEGSWKATAR